MFCIILCSRFLPLHCEDVLSSFSLVLSSVFLCCWVYLYLFFGLCLFPVSPVSLPCPLCVFPQSCLCLVSLPPCLVSRNCFHVSLFVCPSFVSTVVLCPFAFFPPAPPSRSMFPHPGLVFRVLCLVFSFSSCSLVCRLSLCSHLPLIYIFIQPKQTARLLFKLTPFFKCLHLGPHNLSTLSDIRISHLSLSLTV